MGADTSPRSAAPRGAVNRVAGVLLDSQLPQLDHLFDYAIPEDLREKIAIGQRVRVPFRSGKRSVFGWVITLAEESSFSGELSQLTGIVSELPLLQPRVYELARALADRAAGNASDILRLAIPARHVRAEKKFLKDREAGQLPETLTPETDSTAQSIASLLTAGEHLAITESHGPVRLDNGIWVSGWAKRLAATAEAVYASGRSVIIAVPDYRDLDQVRSALTVAPIRVDAKQSNEERFREFLIAADHTPRIILGNRSAVYAPAHNLGAILLWDDGDPLLSEPLSPYVHCRDAALMRARIEQCGLMFFAHARSTEVQRLVEIGYVKAQEHPPQRVAVRHADHSAVPDAFAGRTPGAAIQLINHALQRGPVLVQVAAPGYAPVAVCANCHELAHCAHCKGPVSFRRAARPACRWCGALVQRFRCENCSGTQLTERGHGSQRTAEQFAQQFPHARILVSDGEQPRERVDARPAIVIATPGAEPIAAGGYQAVVLLDVERLLSRPTLRAGEDCLRWWENAASKASLDGICLVASGSGPVVQAFVTGNTETWLRSELRDRSQLRYPPMVRVASVTGAGAEAAAASLADIPEHDTLGPAPTETGDTKMIVRFSYEAGDEVARRLRAKVVTEASQSKRNPRPLRLKFDDRDVFDDWS